MDHLQCVSETCDKPMAPGEDFCGLCGTDNRPPAHRQKVKNCVHRFLDPAALYCSRCGAARHEQMVRHWLWTPTGIACLVGVCLGILFIVLTWLATDANSILGQTGYGEWTRIEFRDYGRRRGNGMTTNGRNVMVYGLFAVAGICYLGWRSKRKYDNGGWYTD